MSLVTTLQHRELQPGVKKIMRCNCGLHARTLSDLQHNKHVYDRRLYFGEVFIKKNHIKCSSCSWNHIKCSSCSWSTFQLQPSQYHNYNWINKTVAIVNCNQVSTTITTGSISKLQLVFQPSVSSHYNQDPKLQRVYLQIRTKLKLTSTMNNGSERGYVCQM